MIRPEFTVTLAVTVMTSAVKMPVDGAVQISRAMSAADPVTVHALRFVHVRPATSDTVDTVGNDDAWDIATTRKIRSLTFVVVRVAVDEDVFVHAFCITLPSVVGLAI
jgi:hypothetical protein